MSTPLCNEGCAESVGWLPESSWTYLPSTKTVAQPIYCIDGSPHVAPRGLFLADYGDARQDSSGTNRGLGSSGSVANFVGVSQPSLTVSNTTAYGLDVFGFITLSIAEVSIASDAVYYFDTSAIDYTSGVPVTLFTSRKFEYGVNSGTAVPWRHVINSNCKFLKTIAPGTTSTFGIRTTWTKDSGTSGANDKMNSITSSLRIVAGNS